MVYTTHKNGDEWGMVYESAIPTLHFRYPLDGHITNWKIIENHHAQWKIGTKFDEIASTRIEMIPSDLPIPLTPDIPN